MKCSSVQWFELWYEILEMLWVSKWEQEDITQDYKKKWMHHISCSTIIAELDMRPRYNNCVLILYIYIGKRWKVLCRHVIFIMWVALMKLGKLPATNNGIAGWINVCIGAIREERNAVQYISLISKLFMFWKMF